MKILILASNPRKDLNLDREIRDLRAVIEQSRNRQEFQVEDALAVRVGDLQDLLFRHRPHIVHFCGHGSGQQGLVFEGNDGGEQWVRADALSEMFRLFSGNVNCVLLNACYSEEQANAIVDHIDYVVGMNQEVRDDAAIAFSKGFYRALGYECSVEQAFEFGKNAIQLEISGSSKMRSAATEAARKAEVVDAIQQTAIPEHLKPILKTRPTVISTRNAPPAQPLSQETLVAIQVEIDQSLEVDAREQYRKKVRELLVDHELTRFEQIRLEQLQKNLGLSAELVAQILAEEQQPIQQARDHYQEMLIRLIEEGEYPFNPDTETALQQYCQELQLTEKEVKAIQQPILEAAAEEYQAKLAQEQQEYQRKLQRYEQEFTKAINLQYPIDTFVRDELKKIQQSLALSDEDIATIENPMIASKEIAYQQQREQQQELERQRQLEAERQQAEAKRQQELERQRQLEAERQQAEAKQPKRFEFQVPQVNIGRQTIEKSGFLGKKTETITTCNITYRPGQANYWVEDLGKGVTLEMVSIPGGTFLMGSPENEKERDSSEGPQHQVTVQPFWMGKFAVTQAQYEAIVGENPAHFKGDKRPVEQVSWHDAVKFCDQLSKKTGRPYRLPSEAEWEYACRAGTPTPFYCGETITTDLANYYGNYTYGSGPKGTYREETIEVGSFPPNAFGLYDMHGNIREWCADHWHENYQGAPTDGSAWMTGGDSSYRLLRGGSWHYTPGFCRSAFRIWGGPNVRHNFVGFRIVSPAA